jgi:uncharacterized protein
MTGNPMENESLLPYARWAEEAMRAVVADALAYASAHGLPGEHHFYITFRTDWPGASLPGHLKARYPDEMTIVLQHRFWDLKLDRAAGTFSVGLSFGGVPASLVVPLKAVTAFADPHVRFGLRFQGASAPAEEGDETSAPAEATSSSASAGGTASPAAAQPAAAQPVAAQPQVVRLDTFRRRPTTPPSSE